MGRVGTTLLLLAAVILQTQELPQQDNELPQLSKDIEGRTESSTHTSVTVSFLQWNNQMIGELPPTNYKVKINEVTKIIPHNPNTERVNQTFNNLVANTEYTVEVGCQIRDDDCPGPIQTFKTCTAIDVLKEPSTPVAKSYTCTEVQHDGRQRWKCTITWQDNSCPGSVNYTIKGDINKETSSHSADVYLDGNKQYHIVVIAKNSDGRESDLAYFPNKTDQLAPQFGSSTFTVTGSNSTCVKLTWQRPEYPGGVITSYQYKCAAGGWSSTRSLSTLSCGHQPYTNIKCYLKALNNLESVEITASGSKFCAAPESPSYSMMIYRGQNEKTDLSIDLKESAPHCQYIRHYVITVKNEDGLILHEQTYNRHGKFNITGLDRFTVYTVMVQVFNNEGLTSSSSQNITAENVKLKNGDSGVGVIKSSKTGAIAGAVIGSILLIVIAGCIFFFLYRRKKMRARNGSSAKFNLITVTGISRNHSESSSAASDETAPLQGGNDPENPEVPDIPRNPAREAGVSVHDNGETHIHSEPIPISKLGWYIKTNICAMRAQYCELEQLPLPERTVASLPENDGKCKYKRIHTSDKYRVKLKRDNLDETDFINATFIKGYRRENQYIASMGPHTLKVVCDFWLMIWQQNPSAIVMLTRTWENKVKCSQYFPASLEKTLKFGEFTITCRSIEMYTDFSTQILEVFKGRERKVFSHFNYLTWPDHGVPDIEVFVAFHRLIKYTVHMGTRQPLLVHCSAGVGRTGTYIALDYLLEQAKQEGKVDALRFVADMRARRPLMVQTVDQYILLYKALYESFFTENFFCFPSDLPAKLSQHRNGSRKKSDMISVEYKHILERVNQLELSYESGKMLENKEKNRFSEILPCDDYRLFLSDGKDGDYINAVTVNGYRATGRWVATQNPLLTTIDDFWELMVEQNVKIIVQLEKTQNPFYPLNDYAVMPIDPFSITRKSSMDCEHVKVIDLLLEKDPHVQRDVTIITAKNWPSGSLPPSALFLSLQDMLEKLSKQTGSAEVCVVCQDGSTRCGLFICAYNAIDKLKLEQRVDVYYPTMMAKLRRPQFIPTMEQYSFLYQVVKDYAGNR